MGLLIAAGWYGSGLCSGTAHAARPEDQLRELRQKILEEQRVVQDIKEKRSTVLGSLESLDRKIAVAQSQYRSAEKNVAKTGEEIKVLKQELASLREQIGIQQEVRTRRLVSYYRFGRTGFLPVLFADATLPDKFRNLKSMETILEADWERFRAFHALLQGKRQAEEKLSIRLEEEKRLKQKMKQSILDQKASRQAKDDLLFQLSRDEELHASLLSELEGSAKNLVRLMREQEALRRQEAASGLKSGGRSLASQKGRLPWPVEGDVYRKFGRAVDPLHQEMIRNQGIDIQTKPGVPVRSVWQGEVAYADWFRGYGKLLIVDHGDKSFSVLSHMSRLTKKKGERVESGEIVGYAGDTGSLEGSLVHFEIWNDGQARDPLEWLRPPSKGSLARAQEPDDRTR